MIEDIQFEVGGKYENMKGVFEVIAIRRDTMDIRWESGEEISTPIELQQRILERMQHEKEMAEAKAIQKAKKAKASTSKAGKRFTGLETTDFSNTVSKTAWRGRGQLGGAVAQRFKSRQFKFNSWAVLRKPEVNWLDIKRQKQADLPQQAKFYARLDAEHFYVGFHILAADPSATEKGDWQALMAWLEKPENNSWVNKQCLSHDLYLCDLTKQGFGGSLEADDDKWVHREADKKDKAVDSISAFLKAAGESGTLDLRIEKRIEKNAAIEKKQSIAEDVASLFESLLPLYAAAADHSS